MLQNVYIPPPLPTSQGASLLPSCDFPTFPVLHKCYLFLLCNASLYLCCEITAFFFLQHYRLSMRRNASLHMCCQNPTFQVLQHCNLFLCWHLPASTSVAIHPLPYNTTNSSSVAANWDVKERKKVIPCYTPSLIIKKKNHSTTHSTPSIRSEPITLIPLH